MQNVSEAFLDKFKRAHSVSSIPKVEVEWNLNRITEVESLKNGTVTPEDNTFPISSLTAPRRPTRCGIIKGVVTTGYSEGAPANSSSTLPMWRRTYIASPDAKYKYWLSPNYSSSTATNGHYNLSDCEPTVVYKDVVNANKIHVLFENSSANPVDVVISVTTDGTTWTQAGGAWTPDADGKIELWLQDNGTWSDAWDKNLKNMTPLKGLKVKVSKMNKPRVHCHMIEMALKREVDFTDRTVNYDFSYEASEVSFVAPLGRASTAEGNLTLSNHDALLDNERLGSEFYGMMTSPARVRVTMDTTVDDLTETTTQGTMYVETWGEDSDSTRTLSLSDASMFLKKEYPPAMLLEDCTGTEVIWRLLDSVGFSDFIVDEDPNGDMKVDYFWTDPDKTVWDHIRELSDGLQIACYFDEEGTMRIRARERMYNKDPDKSSVWTFDGSDVTQALANSESRPTAAGKLADIIDYEKSADLHANKVTVEYMTTKVSDINKQIPKMEQVWEPEGTVALRTATLYRSMSPTQTYGHFSGSNFASWPYEGYLNMNGEVMKWTKKRYRYIDSDGAAKTKYISSKAEKDVLDSKHRLRSHMNKFDGGLYFGKNRGMFATEPREHWVRQNFTSFGTRHRNGPMYNKAWYTGDDYKNSAFTIKTSKKYHKSHSITVARRGYRNVDAPPTYFGTSLKFDNTKAYREGMAGVYMGGEYNDAGYYIEMELTSNVGTRKYSHEVSFYVRRSNGDIDRIGKGKAHAVSKGKWYDLDVHQTNSASGVSFTIYVNGVRTLNAFVPKADMVASELSGQYGIFARGHTHVSFEYLYATNSIELPTWGGDDFSRFDLLTGGFRSDFYNHYMFTSRNARERLRDKSEGRLRRNSGFFFDDFGPKAHEIREFDVEFEKSPVIHSRLYMSNEWYGDCIEYVSDHKSANFWVVGKGRKNVILNGPDSSIYGGDNVVDQKMFIYGRLVDVEDVQTYEVENTKSINSVGEEELTIGSPWIQSKEAAQKIGDWVANHWSNGSEIVKLTTFGNPMLQVGDIVRISFPRKGMAPTDNEFYITGVSNAFKEGLSTSFTLQRKSDFTV